MLYEAGSFRCYRSRTCPAGNPISNERAGSGLGSVFQISNSLQGLGFKVISWLQNTCPISLETNAVILFSLLFLVAGQRILVRFKSSRREAGSHRKKNTRTSSDGMCSCIGYGGKCLCYSSDHYHSLGVWGLSKMQLQGSGSAALGEGINPLHQNMQNGRLPPTHRASHAMLTCTETDSDSSKQMPANTEPRFQVHHVRQNILLRKYAVRDDRLRQ